MANPKPNQATSCCLASVIVGFIAIVIFCGGILNGAPHSTPEQDQLEYDRNIQARQQMEEEDAAREQLLKEGRSPEDVEAAINTERAIKQAQGHP